MGWDDTKIDGNTVEPDEYNDMVADQKTRLGPVFNVISYNASPDGGTTTTGSITAATDDLVVASASTFAIGQGIVINGAKLDATDTGNTEDTDNDFTTTGGAADFENMARKFTAINSGAVGAIANIRLKKTGAPAGTIHAEIYSDSSGPSVQIGGASATITNTDLNASGAEESVTWATDWPVLTTGADYWMRLVTTGYTYADGVTEVIWETDADGASGLNECYKWDSNGGPNWTTMGANVGANITVHYNLQTTITALTGTAVTLAANATVTVSGALVSHDEVVAIQAAHTAATVNGGYLWFPNGTYNVSSDITTNADSPLWFSGGATLVVNSGITVTVGNMIRPTHTVFSGSGSLVSAEQAITAVGNTIVANAARVVLNPDADYTMTSTPTIANGTFGQRVTLAVGNAEANSVTIQDQDTLGSSNLQLLATTRTISAKTAMVLEFDGTNWIEVGSLEFGTLTIGSPTDYIEISAAGFVSLHGAARATMDIHFDPSNLKIPAANFPAAAEKGLTPVFLFDKAADEELRGTFEMPHNYDPETDLKAHFHWAPVDADAGDVTWGVEWHVTSGNSDDVLTAGTTTQIVVDATESRQDEPLKSGDITIDGTGIVLENTFHFRIFRDANASEIDASDTYDDDAALIFFDIEYMIKGFGEDEQW